MARKETVGNYPDRGASPHKRLRYTLILFSCAFATIGSFIFAYDDPIRDFARSYRFKGDVEKGFLLSEAFAHGIGVLAILLVLFQIRPDRKWQLWRATLMAAGAGVIANALKGVFARARPFALDELERISSQNSWIESGASFMDAHLRSFPSGHSATAVGFAIGLSYAFPQARVLFAIYAALACYQRIYVDAHYASDVFWGAAIATMWCWLCLQPFGLGKLLDEREGSS